MDSHTTFTFFLWRSFAYFSLIFIFLLAFVIEVNHVLFLPNGIESLSYFIFTQHLEYLYLTLPCAFQNYFCFFLLLKCAMYCEHIPLVHYLISPPTAVNPLIPPIQTVLLLTPSHNLSLMYMSVLVCVYSCIYVCMCMCVLCMFCADGPCYCAFTTAVAMSYLGDSILGWSSTPAGSF